MHSHTYVVELISCVSFHMREYKKSDLHVSQANFLRDRLPISSGHGATGNVVTLVFGSRLEALEESGRVSLLFGEFVVCIYLSTISKPIIYTASVWYRVAWLEELTI